MHILPKLTGRAERDNCRWCIKREPQQESSVLREDPRWQDFQENVLCRQRRVHSLPSCCLRMSTHLIRLPTLNCESVGGETSSKVVPPKDWHLRQVLSLHGKYFKDQTSLWPPATYKRNASLLIAANFVPLWSTWRMVRTLNSRLD